VLGVLGVLALVFVLLAGPTLFILDLTVNRVGLMFDNFFATATWTDPIEKSSFPKDWTGFYWAWWVAYTGSLALIRIHHPIIDQRQLTCQYLSHSSNTRQREVDTGRNVFQALKSELVFCFGRKCSNCQVNRVEQISSIYTLRRNIR
jgi:hypothetical protein